ncbi:MAG: hypothetical protein Kow0092_07690 [Deferrisomatales bacterium]
MDRRGFTLVETLVALVVLAVGLLALTKMSVTYVRANGFSHQLSEATVLAHEKMEQLRSYATSERADKYSVFDFDYLTSTAAVFASVEDPPDSGTLVQVPGLLAGGSATAVTTTGGTTYEVLYDDGAHGDAGADDGVWGNTESVAIPGQSGVTMTRTWTVEPLDTLPVGSPDGVYDYARLTVLTRWTDRSGRSRQVYLQSVVHRRQ